MDSCYTTNVSIVMRFMEDQKYSDGYITCHRQCYTHFGEYLESSCLQYSEETASKWISLISEKYGHSTLKVFRSALERLDDVYKTGSVKKEHGKEYPDSCFEVPGAMQPYLDEYLSYKKSELSAGKYRIHYNVCVRFVFLLHQRSSVYSPDGISLTAITDFFDNSDGFPTGLVKGFLSYLYDRQMVSYGCTVILHYLAAGLRRFWEVPCPDNVSVEASKGLPLPVLAEAIRHIYNKHRADGHTKSVYCTFAKAANLFYLFLEANCLGYTTSVACWWYDTMKESFHSEHYSARRTLCLLDEYIQKGSDNLARSFWKKGSRYYDLPEWYRKAADSFLSMKAAEGLATSTLVMYRSCIVRFYTNICAQGVTSFDEIDAAIVKQFNASDFHETSLGKNAYNCRIRVFLEYLSSNGYNENKYLYLALPCANAPGEKNIIILTDDELESLVKKLDQSDSSLSCREKAMILLGIGLGIRSTDIVQMQIKDIDPESATLRFVQQKTNVEVLLPMPVNVANALYRYLLDERPDSESGNIFLKSRAPFNEIGRAACARALEKALPEVETGGFHITRRTYGTGLLREGVSADTVSDALGQTNRSSLKRYLSLDDERMALCPIPLSLKDLEMKGGFYE